MEQVWYSYDQWEDYQAGLYKSGVSDKVSDCANLLRSDGFYNQAKLMVNNWKKSAEFNLTNSTKNHQSWLGQATCCYKYGANCDTVIEAWHLLSREEQDKANKIADKVFVEWKINYVRRAKCQNVNLELMF